MSSHIAPVRTYLAVFAALLGLLVLTLFTPRLGHGLLNVVAVLSIAAAKALLIVLFFMHLRYSTQLTQLFAFAAFFWLGILLALAMSDYQTRAWAPSSPLMSDERSP